MDHTHTYTPQTAQGNVAVAAAAFARAASQGNTQAAATAFAQATTNQINSGDVQGARNTVASVAIAVAFAFSQGDANAAQSIASSFAIAISGSGNCAAIVSQVITGCVVRGVWGAGGVGCWWCDS